jgi:RAB protein geranylgeranyltransferase component A
MSNGGGNLTQHHYDLVIVGGGMVGSALAAALGHFVELKNQQSICTLSLLFV